MEHSFVHIYTGSSVVVLALRNALEAENIIPVIKDESESARMAGFGITQDQQQVFVHQDELQKAEKVLSTLELQK